MRIVDPFPAVCIRIDSNLHALFKSIRDPRPIEIEAVGIGIQLNNHAIGRTGIDNRLMIDGISLGLGMITIAAEV